MRKLTRPATIAICIIIIAGMLYLSTNNEMFIADRSAQAGAEMMIWNGKSHSIVNGKYTEGKTIAKSANGWNINEVKEDPSHTFVVARSFLDQYLYVADDYCIPESGKVTKIYWNGTYVTDKDFIHVMTEIDAAKTATFDYETEGIFMLTDNQCMKDLYFAYEDCPVATEFKGYMGKINDNWIITIYISSVQTNDDGSPKPYTVTCYSIPEQYAGILEKYF